MSAAGEVRFGRSKGGAVRRTALTAFAVLVISLASAAPIGASSPAGKKSAPVRAVAFNQLHGLFCMPDETDFCNAPARVEIFGKWLERSKCPELVGLQEINVRLTELITDLVTEVCDGEYEIATQPTNEVDTQTVLTTLEIEEQGVLDLANFPWEAAWVRVSSPQGPIDFLTAHFASGANDPDCTAEICPPVCAPGISTNECHAHEVVEFFEGRSGAAVTLVAGDLNAVLGDPTLEALIDARFVDSWLEAGKKECDPETGIGCTGGCDEAPSTYIGMETKAGLECNRRIDFVMARPGDDCKLKVTSAKGFAHKPLASPIDSLYWPSDHKGSQAAFRCT
jgi:hypothetical protein